MEMIDDITQDFILAHRNEDVRKLAFAADKYPDVDFSFALDQIQGWQTARNKLPSWASTNGIVYPPHLNMEQCSSEFTACYKSRLVQNMGLLIDLTGGFGVDFSYMSHSFDHAVYVERNPKLFSIAKHNFKLLGLNNTEIVNEDSAIYLNSLVKDMSFMHKTLDGKGVCVFLDPARRDSYGRKMASMSDCEPDVIELLPDISRIASVLLLKLSPMLDWHEAVREINSANSGFDVSEVHVVSVKNECKELLLLAKNNLLNNENKLKIHENNFSPTLICVNDEQLFSCPAYSSLSTVDMGNNFQYANLSDITPHQSVLLVPNSSIMKAGCFKSVAEKFGIQLVGHDSHIYVANHRVPAFPGREFEIIAVSSMNKRELRSNLTGITHANIAVRNFPMKAEALRKRLKLIDGGEVYIFATTASEGSHVLIITKKVV